MAERSPDGVGTQRRRGSSDRSNARAKRTRSAPPGPDLLLLGSLPLTPQARAVVRHASEEARRLDHSAVGTVHLLLALLREPDGIVAHALKNLSIQADELRLAVLELPAPSTS